MIATACSGGAQHGTDNQDAPEEHAVSPTSSTTSGSQAQDQKGPSPEDVAEETGLGGTRYGRGVSIIDLNGDGWEDLFLADTDGRTRGEQFGVSQVYRNVRGSFERWDLGLAAEDLYANTGAAFGDMDRDGDPDVLLVNGNNTTRSRLALYENRVADEGRFVPVSERSGIPSATEAWWGAAWVDVNMDSALDIIVTGSRTALLINDGEGRFHDETKRRGLGQWLLDPVHKNPVVTDVDSDGAPDLVSGGGSPAVVFRNDGRGFFEDVTATALPSDLPEMFWLAGFAAAAEDFNQDGHDDIYLGRFWYRDYLLLNRGDGTFSAHSEDIGLDMSSYSESVPFFGGNASQERSTSPTAPTTWQWPGEYTTGDQESENTMGLTVGDLDDDGAPDVMIGTGDPSSANPDIILCGDAPGDGSVSFRRCHTDLTEAQGPTRGHGFAMGDLDQDGTTDLITNPGGWTEYDTEVDVDTRESAKVYRGRDSFGDDGPARVQLVTDGREALGARLKVTTKIPRYRTVRSTQGFQSRSSNTFLLQLAEPTRVEIRWPGGQSTDAVVEPGSTISIESAP